MVNNWKQAQKELSSPDFSFDEIEEMESESSEEKEQIMSQLPNESLPEYKSNTGFGESTMNVDIVSPYAMHDPFDFNSRKNGQ